MNKIKSILMSRDDTSSEEADDLIEEARNEMHRLIEAGDFTAAEDICADYFGLEPDFLEELL